MNVFPLCAEPKAAAFQQCDKHAVKMFSESLQMHRSVANQLMNEANSDLPRFMAKPKPIYKQVQQGTIIAPGTGEEIPNWVTTDEIVGYHQPKEFKGFANHPCTQWVKASLSNWRWLLQHARALHTTYKLRYNRDHAELYILEELECFPISDFLADHGLTDFALAMPDWVPGKTLTPSEYLAKGSPDNVHIVHDKEGEPVYAVRTHAPLEEAVQIYRNYYIHCKTHFAKWAHSVPPAWWPGYDTEGNSSGYAFPTGALFCRINKRNEVILAQVDLMLDIEEEQSASDTSYTFELLELYNTRKRKASRKASDAKTPSINAPLDEIRNRIKESLKSKIPPRKTVQQWVDEFPEKADLEVRIQRHIDYWQKKGFGHDTTEV